MAQTAPELRLLVPQDAPALAALEAQVFADGWEEDRFRDLLGQDRFLGAGAFGQSGLCAYLTAYSVAGELEIVNVAVAPPFRGHGLGRALLRFFLEQGRLRGAARAVLEVRRSNAPARALYAGAGFVQVGERKRYYADNGEDALVLEWTPCPGS
jgi:[ribosomal protein S18]-alanine N-acetyltransferase